MDLASASPAMGQQPKRQTPRHELLRAANEARESALKLARHGADVCTNAVDDAGFALLVLAGRAGA